MFNEPVSLGFIFASIAVILVLVAVAVMLVNAKTKKLKESHDNS